MQRRVLHAMFLLWPEDDEDRMSSRRGKVTSSAAVSATLPDYGYVGSAHHDPHLCDAEPASSSQPLPSALPSSSPSSSRTRLPLRTRRRRGRLPLLPTSGRPPTERSAPPSSSRHHPSFVVMGSLAVLNAAMIWILLRACVQNQAMDGVRIRWPSMAVPFLGLLRNGGNHGGRIQFRHKVYRPHRTTSLQSVVSSWARSASASPSSTSAQQQHPEEQPQEQQPRPQQPRPVLVVGLPKAGTSTLFEFFACYSNQRLRTQHWYCCGPQRHAQRGGPRYMSECMLYNLQEGLPILDGCGDYDVYTELNGPRPQSPPGKQSTGRPSKGRRGGSESGGGAEASSSPLSPPSPGGGSAAGRSRGIFLPQRYHLQELHDYDPHAPWVLNLRPVEDWVDSVLRNAALTRALVEEVQEREGSPPQNRTVPTPRGRNETRAFLRDVYESQADRVRDFCRRHHHPLIEVSITDPHAGVHLVESLGWDRETTDRATACWGRHNVGSTAFNNNNSNNNDDKTLVRPGRPHETD